ncbi:hypothetical protein C8R43DRAFT_1018803 [Mycena crocata]|nr:hypothetical protein C8R43DRAFT_1018803 [Mycena crocata]
MDLNHLRSVDPEENMRRMRKGEPHYAFTPDLIADRKRCAAAFRAFNNAGDVSRRELVQLFKNIQDDKTPMPAPAATPEEDEDVLSQYVWCDGPIKFDYGRNVKFGENVYVNSNSTWIDTCLITVGARTIIGASSTSLVWPIQVVKSPVLIQAQTVPSTPAAILRILLSGMV